MSRLSPQYVRIVITPPTYSIPCILSSLSGNGHVIPSHSLPPCSPPSHFSGVIIWSRSSTSCSTACSDSSLAALALSLASFRKCFTTCTHTEQVYQHIATQSHCHTMTQSYSQTTSHGTISQMLYSHSRCTRTAIPPHHSSNSTNTIHPV